jgi:hypothetical protein
MDINHLNALQIRLSHERGYLAQEKTVKGRELRQVWINQVEEEIEAERAFLGLAAEEKLDDMSADDLLAELLA